MWSRAFTSAATECDKLILVFQLADMAIDPLTLKQVFSLKVPYFAQFTCLLLFYFIFFLQIVLLKVVKLGTEKGFIVGHLVTYPTLKKTEKMVDFLNCVYTFRGYNKG